jgi:hypothetical protein
MRPDWRLSSGFFYDTCSNVLGTVHTENAAYT